MKKWNSQDLREMAELSRSSIEIRQMLKEIWKRKAVNKCPEDYAWQQIELQSFEEFEEFFYELHAETANVLHKKISEDAIKAEMTSEKVKNSSNFETYEDKSNKQKMFWW